MLRRNKEPLPGGAPAIEKDRMEEYLPDFGSADFDPELIIQDVACPQQRQGPDPDEQGPGAGEPYPHAAERE